jgi:nicotinamidase/pyrazinamidase
MKALLLIDLQNDFCPGGALAVKEGDQVIPIANALMPHFDLVVATQDWHPADHGSFAAMYPFRRPGQVIELDGLSQVLWPIHCVQDSFGAELVADLDQSRITRIFYKGTEKNIDSYSGFFDNGRRKATGLGDYLKAQGVSDVYVMGLATDYCVKFSTLDALSLGFKTYLVQDGCRGVELQAGDIDRALIEMQEKGADLIQSGSLLPG